MANLMDDLFNLKQNDGVLFYSHENHDLSITFSILTCAGDEIIRINVATFDEFNNAQSRLAEIMQDKPVAVVNAAFELSKLKRFIDQLNDLSTGEQKVKNKFLIAKNLISVNSLEYSSSDVPSINLFSKITTCMISVAANKQRSLRASVG